MLMDLRQETPSVNRLYKLITSCVVPRPIAVVSSISPEGVRNVAPFSYFNFVSTTPLMLMFAPILDGDGKEKDSLRNASATKEFVVALATESIIEQVNQASANYPAEVDEFEKTGLTPAPASIVKASLVAESPVNFECVLHDVIRLGTHPYAGNIVLGEVKAIHIEDSLLDENGRIITDKLNAVGRMGGGSYVRTHDTFDLPRPIFEEES